MSGDNWFAQCALGYRFRSAPGAGGGI
jgi:hypothetical protein